MGGAANEASESMGADGYATGSDVAFRSAPSLHTAAHEAAHVVQQRAGVHLKSGAAVGATGGAAIASWTVMGNSRTQTSIRQCPTARLLLQD